MWHLSCPSVFANVLVYLSEQIALSDLLHEHTVCGSASVLQASLSAQVQQVVAKYERQVAALHMAVSLFSGGIAGSREPTL